MAFGGKNDYTLHAPDELLKLNSWDSETLFEFGHSLIKIGLKGSKRIRNQLIPVTIPEGCGYPEKTNRRGKKNVKEDLLSIKQTDEEKIDVTRSFKTRSEFDSFLKFLFSSKYLKGFEWEVLVLSTISVDVKKKCDWRKKKPGDGTSRMVLKLVRLNGVYYEQCLPHDLLSAADGMVGGECRTIQTVQTPPTPKDLCETHAEANIDPNTVKAAT